MVWPSIQEQFKPRQKGVLLYFLAVLGVFLPAFATATNYMTGYALYFPLPCRVALVSGMAMSPIEARHVTNQTDEALWGHAGSNPGQDIGILQLLSPTGNIILSSQYIHDAATFSRATQWPEYRAIIRKAKRLNISLTDFRLRYTRTVQLQEQQLNIATQDFSKIAPGDLVYGMQIRKHLDRYAILRPLDFEIVVITHRPDMVVDDSTKTRWQQVATEAGLAQMQLASWAVLFAHKK